MTSPTRNDQEELWAGSFGDEYILRNRGEGLVANNAALFRKVLAAAGPVSSALELGCNIGNNLRALRQLLPEAELHGVEINESAAAEVESWGGASVEVGSILDFKPGRTWELTFTKGVLIHIAPERLTDVYDALVQCSERYLMVCEYYNPTPMALSSYRGHGAALFKRDFAGEILDRHPDLELVDYGFTYHRDPQHPLDDSTWFLMRKP